MTDPGRRAPSPASTHRAPRTRPLAPLLLAGLLLACTGGADAPPEDTPPTATTSTAATSTPTEAPSMTAGATDTPVATPRDPVSAERAMEHVRQLAVEIGPRVAGSAEEREAADYIAFVLAEAGYETAIEEFTFEALLDESHAELPDGRIAGGYAMEGSPNETVRGRAVFGGLGSAEDLAGADLDGRIVIFDRGTVTFLAKARAAEAGGAAGVVIVNNEDGPFLGALGGEETSIPVISVALSEREALQAAIGEQVTVVADAGVRTKTSQNVVGRTSEPCVAYLGAHYDSVAAGPGANDNASGTAVLLELARVHRTEGLCAIAFGAEEVGLFGSRDYVDQHLVGTARFMLNIDMAGRLDGPVIVGDRDLTRSILDAVEAAGVDTPLRPGSFPPFASSDHVSFEAVGVPAVTFNSGDDDAIHTAEDTIDRVSVEALDVFLEATDAALAALMPERAPAATR